MARLITLMDFAEKPGKRGLDPRWYFEDAWFDDRGTGSWSYDVAVSYPHPLYMHRDRLDEEWFSPPKHAPLRVEIRRWVERSLAGDAVLTFEDRSYRYRRPKHTLTNDYDGDYSERVDHGYYKFNFETTADQVMFQLRFAEYIDEPQLRHPQFGWVTEENCSHGLY